MVSKDDLQEYKKILTNNFYSMEDNIQKIPFDTFSEEECMELIKTNGKCLKYIPQKFKMKKEICMEAYRNTLDAFVYFPKEFYTIELCIDCYKKIEKKVKTLGYSTVSLREISSYIPEEYHKNERIFKLERKLEIRKIIGKKYEKEYFYVEEKVKYLDKPLVSQFDNFKTFYKFIDKDLREADLLDYDFCNIDLRKIDISGAYIRSDVLEKYGLYSDKFYYES